MIFVPIEYARMRIFIEKKVENPEKIKHKKLTETLQHKETVITLIA